jgi:hypothetical protein
MKIRIMEKLYLHERLCKKRAVANLAGMEDEFCPKESAFNSALLSVCTSEKLPRRDQLILLSAAEDESMKQIHAAMHAHGMEWKYRRIRANVTSWRLWGR